jgi:HlyD family secretion protein
MLGSKSILPVGGVLIAAVALAGCREAESRVANEPTIPAVEAVEARYGALPLSERLTGTVRAAGQVSIYPEASGRP